MFSSEKIVPIIAQVMSEETGVPKHEIDLSTRIPANEKGVMTVMRMANAIPDGGGNLAVEFSAMCTVGELAELCLSEMRKIWTLAPPPKHLAMRQKAAVFRRLFSTDHLHKKF